MEILLDTLKWSVIVGLAALGLALLKPVLEQRYSARWRYWVWLVLAALALLAPVQWEKLAPAAGRVNAQVVIKIPELAVQVSRENGMSVSIQPAAALPTSPVTDAPAASRTWKLDDILPTVWLAGAAVFLLYHFAGTLAFRHRARRWSRQPNEETARLYEAVWRDMGLKKAPPLLISSAVNSPVLIGLLRPRLLLPYDGWRERELTFILRHELTHYRRRDLWYKLVLLAANALHWFNPLLYFMVREAGADIELTCDDAVVAGADGETRRAYSETLLAAIHREKGFGSALSTHFYGGKRVMKERFRNILGKRGRKWGGLVLALTLLAVVVSACTFGLRQGQDGAASISGQGQSPSDQIRTYAQDYVAGQIARYENSAVIIADSRFDLALAGEYSLELYDGYIEVWELDYALKLENPEYYTPVGSEELDGDGWLTGTDSQGEPHLIAAVDRKQQPYEYSLQEVAYSNVQTELGYTWEEYVFCHTVAGIELSPVLNGWPEITTDFMLALEDGHNTWSMDWVDVARSYFADLKNGLNAGSFDTLYTFTGNDSHDESRLIQFSVGSRRWTMMLVRVLYPLEPDGALGIWQVTGCRWGAEHPISDADLAQLPGILADTLNYYDDLFDKALKSDGAYAEAAAQDLKNAFDANPNTFVSAMSRLERDDMQNIASLLVYGEGYDDYEGFKARVAQMASETPDFENSPIIAIQEAILVTDALNTLPEPLTAAELADFERYFNNRSRNGLLRFAYDSDSFDAISPYWEILFYDAGEPVTDEAERAAVAELFGGMLETDCTKLTVDFVMQYCNAYFTFMQGVPLDQAARGTFVQSLDQALGGHYLPEYDAYYMVHGDTNMVNYTFTAGERYFDGSVALNYTADIWELGDDGSFHIAWEQPMQVILLPNGANQWQVASNQS